MKQYQNEAWLWQQYIYGKRSLRAIADECGISHTTVFRYLRMFGIPTRPQKESVTRKGLQQPQKQKTQTIQERVELLGKIDKELNELEEIQELKKALRGEESNYYVSPSDIEANQLKAHAKARAEREKQLREDEAFEKRRRGDTGAWHTGDWREQLEDIMYKLGERI